MRYLIVLFGLVAAGPAHANFYDGQRFLDRCGSKKSDFCVGYIAGAMDGTARRICPHPSTTPETALDAILTYLRQQPYMRVLPMPEILPFVFPGDCNG